jgi:hypothetical protein
VILTQKPDKVLLYNYRKWYEYKKSSQNLKSTQDSQFIAEDKLQIMTMEVTSSSKQFYMDRDNTNGR